jgi:polar amino acid transport system substrate-binding protein
MLLIVASIPSEGWAISLRIATDKWVPYENLADPELPGFSTEVIQAVFASMGIDIKIHEYPWIRALQGVYRGNSDALYSAFWSEERARECYYPQESLIQEKWVFFIRRKDVGRLTFYSYEDLKGTRIGVLRKASITPEFWKFAQTDYIVEEVSIDEQNFKKLLKHRIDYVVTGYSNGITLLKTMGIGDQVVPLEAKSLLEDYLYLIFSKKTVTQELVNQFSTALQRFKTTRTYHNIYEKYFEFHD